MFDLRGIAPEQFINDGMARIPAGPAMLYLFRRYGYPQYFGYKNLTIYSVETCVEDVFVNLHVGGKNCYITPSAAVETHQRYDKDELESYWHDKPASDFVVVVQDAVRDCLLDQLRPVRVRDVYINILGPGVFEWDEEAEEAVGEVPYFELEKNNKPDEHPGRPVDEDGRCMFYQGVGDEDCWNCIHAPGNDEAREVLVEITEESKQ